MPTVSVHQATNYTRNVSFFDNTFQTMVSGPFPSRESLLVRVDACSPWPIVEII
jgi:hypothetical protein